MKFVIACMLLLSNFFKAPAQQKLFTKTGTVVFFSKAPVENIKAKNNKLLSVWDVATGQIEFSVLMKGFEFEKALMQEHFNENYVESDKYPKATFKGIVETPKNLFSGVDGNYSVVVNGTLTLHGITKPVMIPAKVQVNNKIISASAAFIILLTDYNIKIPAIVADNISNHIQITVVVPSYQPLSPH
ncbi:MAG: YceI family protein [Ferruginibacter sp.]